MSRFDLFYVLIDECSEVVDYAIAKKIVEIHSYMEDTIETMYSQEDILTYIGFARQFKPQITIEASNKLVAAYTELRQRDSQSSTKSTWRITVRQLESLIRLSEAMAKMECSDHVTTKHVSEAFNLLNKSIIRVEQPDVNLNDDDYDDLNTVPETDGMDVDPAEGSEKRSLTKKKLTLSFDEYKRITNMLVVYLRNEEEKRIAERGLGEDGGLLRSDIINWYLEKIEDQINDETELLEKKSFIEKILDRLIYNDNVLIALSQHPKPLQSENVELDLDEEDDDPVLVVHPNFKPDI